MLKAVYSFLIVALLLGGYFVCLVSTVKAQEYGTIYFEADNAKVAAIYVYDNLAMSGTNYTSFPDSRSFSKGPYLVDPCSFTITVYPESGYTFSYADDGSSSYLSNPFNFYGYDGTTLTFYFSAAPEPTPTPDPSATPTATPASPTGYRYIFYGLYDETNIYSYLTNVTITAYYPNGSVGIGGRGTEVFICTQNYTYQPPSKPMYFSYDLSQYYGENMTRQYWVGLTEVDATLYVYAVPSGLTPITFNIRALGGLDFSGRFLIAKSIYSENIVSKVPVDALGNAVMNLQPYGLYIISIDNGAVYQFGYISSSTSTITLTVSPLSFPSEVLLQYKYLTLYAYRKSATEICVNYNDTNAQTVIVTYAIRNSVGTVLTEYHIGDNSFSDTWTSAVANETYYIEAQVTQSVFGVSTFRQVIGAWDSGYTVLPIDLSVFGTFAGIETDQLLAAFIILVVFACFSALNSYIGVFAGVVTAIIMYWIGWLDSVNQAILITAFSLAIFMAIVYWKKRGN